MQFLRTIAAVSLTLLLGACATPLRVALTPEQRAKITDVSAHVVVTQDEVRAAVQPSNVAAFTGGGLIGAAIDSQITNQRMKTAQTMMGPFYAAIEDLDFRTEFNDTMRRELTGYPLKVSNIVTTPRSIDVATLKVLRSKLTPGQALLIIKPRYTLTMDFRSLDVETLVTLWVKDGPDLEPVQRSALHYQSQAIGPGGKPSIDLWSANNAALFRSAVRDAIAETIRLTIVDNGAPPAVVAQPSDLKTYAFNTGGQIGRIQGQQLSETATRAVILGADQKTYSLPKAQPAPTAQ
ncbi:MAG: hypothetical protein RLZZ618_222 [Pseudomonadota bacterium]|jgi:hypothetical protein